jgi:aspartyl-tRNA(Asn)/glutamyl-tRNA(Gln) amidotransferase subunit C
MKVTDQDVSYVADLANLRLTDAERARMVRDLSAILGYIDHLNELDTKNVTLTQVPTLSGESGDLSYSWRDDIREGLRRSLPHDEALQNAPESDGTFFKVPKVIEK